jgi:hypothetical protein
LPSQVASKPLQPPAHLVKLRRELKRLFVQVHGLVVIDVAMQRGQPDEAVDAFVGRKVLHLEETLAEERERHLRVDRLRTAERLHMRLKAPAEVSQALIARALLDRAHDAASTAVTATSPT